MRVENRKAHFDYEVLFKWEAGVVLSGSETKSAKAGAMSLMGSRCVFNDKGELWVMGMQINQYEFARSESYEATRSRKLLLTKKELMEIEAKSAQKGLTVVPLACYTKHGLVKIEVALVRGKKKYEKREEEKKRAVERGVAKLLRNK